MQRYLVLLIHPQTKMVTTLRLRADSLAAALTIAQALYARISAHERN